MGTILELNDYLAAVITPQGITQTHGAAAYAEGNLVFGDAAQARSKTHPQQFNHRYLSSLSAQPLAASMGPAKNHADLVYHHLKALDLASGNQPIAIAVPSHLANEQLGLLLGICQELSITVTGFIDITMAHAMTAAAQGPLTVVDIELHRLTLSHYDVADGEIVLLDNKVWDGRGINHIVEGWMAAVADEFVQQTRFDPLHAGHTEQQLFAMAWTWLNQPPQSRCRIAISQDDQQIEIELSAEVLVDKLRHRFDGVTLDVRGSLFHTHRLASLPGIQDWLAADTMSRALGGPEDVSSIYFDLSERLDPSAIRRMTRSTLLSSVETSSPQLPQPTSATHLLHDNVALPIDSLAGSRAFTPGEKILIDGVQYTSIRVEG